MIFFSFEVGSSDVIMGFMWLEMLGPLTTNWKQQVMKFSEGKQEVVLTRDRSLGKRVVSLKSMIRTIRKEQLKKINGKQYQGSN